MRQEFSYKIPNKLRSEKLILLTGKALKYYKRCHIYSRCVKIKGYFNENLGVIICKNCYNARSAATSEFYYLLKHGVTLSKYVTIRKCNSCGTIKTINPFTHCNKCIYKINEFVTEYNDFSFEFKLQCITVYYSILVKKEKNMYFEFFL